MTRLVPLDEDGKELERPCVYRIYGDDGELLYIGASIRRWRRLRQHRERAPWWPWDYYEHTARSLFLAGLVTFEEHQSQEDAYRAESIAICHENPRFNKVDWFMHEGWETCTGPRHVNYWIAEVVHLPNGWWHDPSMRAAVADRGAGRLRMTIARDLADVL